MVTDNPRNIFYKRTFAVYYLTLTSCTGGEKVRVSGSIRFIGAVSTLTLMICTNVVAATPRQQVEQALQQLAGSIKTAEAGKDWQCAKGGPYWKVMNDRFNGAVVEYQKAKNFEAQGMMVPANASYSSAQVSAQSGQSFMSNCH